MIEKEMNIVSNKIGLTIEIRKSEMQLAFSLFDEYFISFILNVALLWYALCIFQVCVILRCQ